MSEQKKPKPPREVFKEFEQNNRAKGVVFAQQFTIRINGKEVKQ
jgi:hypothetical protein